MSSRYSTNESSNSQSRKYPTGCCRIQPKRNCIFLKHISQLTSSDLHNVEELLLRYRQTHCMIQGNPKSKILRSRSSEDLWVKLTDCHPFSSQSAYLFLEQNTQAQTLKLKVLSQMRIKPWWHFEIPRPEPVTALRTRNVLTRPHFSIRVSARGGITNWPSPTPAWAIPEARPSLKTEC